MSFECQQCGKYFKRAANLRVHEKEFTLVKNLTNVTTVARALAKQAI